MNTKSQTLRTLNRLPATHASQSSMPTVHMVGNEKTQRPVDMLQTEGSVTLSPSVPDVDASTFAPKKTSGVFLHGEKKSRKPWRPNQGRKKPWKQNPRRQKNKKKPARPQGIAHIHSTMNNTIVTLTSLNAHVLSSSSAGRCGFKGCRKSTPYAAQRAAEVAGKKAFGRNLKYIKVHVNGPGLGREKALRGLCKAGLKILLIRDLTRLPHNGCRPAKKRRV